MNERDTAIPKAPKDLPATANQWVMVFEVTTGVGKELSKKVFKVNKPRLIIGSALSSDIRIQQNAVSNLHAVIEMDETGKPVIYDMASETGVFLNDKKIVSESLKDGDELKIGFANLRFHFMPVQEAQSQASKASVKTTSTQKLFYDQKEDFRPLILEDERNIIQIFDYPSANEHSLQIVMYWGDVILDVRHFTEQEPVVLGEGKDATFLVPNFESPYPFISFENGAAVLQIPDNATGVIRAGKQFVPLEKLEKRRLQMKSTDLAKIRLGDITFFVSYAPVPPHLRRQRAIERDPLYFKIWFSSLLLTVALVLVLLKLEPPKPLEVDELPPRVTAIIFKPVVPPPPPPVVKRPPPPPEPVKAEEPKPTPPPPPPKEAPKPKKEPPKKLPTETKKPNPKANANPSEQKTPTKADSKQKGTPRDKAGGDAGEGKRAQGPEGQKGKPNKPKAEVHQVESKGNPNNAGAQKSATTTGKGNVEAMFEDLQGTISQKIAAGSKGASAAGERLHGYGGFTTEGNGGLGNAGSGKGGGGESQSLSQGLGTKGLGEGDHGKGLGAIGSGGNLLGTGRGRPSVQIGGTTETVIMGGLDRSVIDEIIRKHWDQISYCYRKELNASSKPIRGRVLTRFVISATGRVTQAGVETTSMQNPNVERCLLGVLQKIVFPEPVGGTLVEVSYPFAFTPALE